MAVNFAALKSRVESQLLDNNAEVVAEIPNFLNRALEELEDTRAFKVLEATEQKLLPAGTTQLAIPSAFGIPRYYNGMREAPTVVYSYGTGLGMDTELVEDTNDARYTAAWYASPVPTGAPEYYRELDEEYWEFYPDPDYNYLISFPIWHRLADLSDDADTNWFLDNATDFMIWRAVALGHEFNYSPMTDYWRTKADAELARLKRIERKWRFKRMSALVPTSANKIGAR